MKVRCDTLWHTSIRFDTLRCVFIGTQHCSPFASLVFSTHVAQRTIFFQTCEKWMCFIIERNGSSKKTWRRFSMVKILIEQCYFHLVWRSFYLHGFNYNLPFLVVDLFSLDFVITERPTNGSQKQDLHTATNSGKLAKLFNQVLFLYAIMQFYSSVTGLFILFFYIISRRTSNEMNHFNL